jgi:DNA polymerase-1
MIYIDFEFNRTTQENVNLVCCAVYDDTEEEKKLFWLRDSEEVKLQLQEYLSSRSQEIFVAYAVEAEARSFYSLGLDPYQFKWIDLHKEWKCLTNHNYDLNLGKQLKDGKIVTAHKKRPKWERVEGEKESGFKHTHSLAEATYKLLGVIRDTEHKNAMRDLIISDPEFFSPKQKESIGEYCLEDVEFLPRLLQAVRGKYREYLSREYDEEVLTGEMLLRGRYAALTGIRESWGYPIDYKAAKNFSSSVAAILDDCQRDINAQFPDILPFRYNKNSQKFSWNQIATKLWISKNCDVEKWIKTDKGSLSLSLEAFQRFFNYTHDYPRGNFGAQMVRYLKLKQSLNGFVPGGKKSFWDAVGKDKRVRPYMNIYGSQSSRSQPGSTSYILLKPAWQRSMLHPPKGKVLSSIDYGSEEYFISALWYQDKKMIDSYLSGDVYLAFAKDSGAVPQDATKSSHKKERNEAKSTILGLSYLMSKYGLSIKLTADTGREWTPEDAQEKIDVFNDTYSTFYEGMNDFIEEYRAEGYFKGIDGWYMWGDNDNFRSIANVPIQYLGAAIMRKADMLAYERRLKVVCTLHDALYIEHDEEDLGAVDTLADCMREAFVYYFQSQKDIACQIRLDPFTWGDVFTEDSEIITPKGMTVPVSPKYIDERAIEEYNIFSKYFEDREEFWL